jgi:hypothetical protein
MHQGFSSQNNLPPKYEWRAPLRSTRGSKTNAIIGRRVDSFNSLGIAADSSFMHRHARRWCSILHDPPQTSRQDHKAAEISGIHVAEEEEAGLVVMASRGLSEWKALLLGSVSDHVLHHAHCSVLIVR